MTSAELKLSIFRQLDVLDKHKLEDFYGILQNYFNSTQSSEEWFELSKSQQQGILEAEQEIIDGKGIPHHEVINMFNDKFKHG